MESQRKELGCLLDFWSWDLGVLRGGAQKEQDWVKDDKSAFHVGFGVSVTHSVDNFHSYIYPY